jgi:signal transduction histidine kinase
VEDRIPFLAVTSPASAPPWLTHRRIVIAGVLLSAAAAGIAWNHVRSERAFLRSVSLALPLSVDLSASLLGDWLALRRDAFSLDTPVTYRVRETGPETSVLQLLGRDTTGRPLVREVPLAEATFPQFNVAARDDRTQRTILIEPTAGGVRTVLVSAPGGSPRPVRAAPAVPRGLEGGAAWRGQLQNRESTPTEGLGVGIMGQPVVRAHAPVPGTPFILVRERDSAELLQRLRPSLMMTDAIFALLALLAVALWLFRARAVMLRAERDAMALRSVFVSSVSHELRTPLTQIRMYAEMLQLGYLPDAAERERALDVIAREAGRLGVLVDQALAYVREGERPRGRTSVSAVAVATERATATLAALLAEHHVTVVADVPTDLHVTMDADGLQQVLLNLLANALKYGPPHQTIRVAATRVDAMARVTVDDEGPGIPDAERLRVWQPFVRGASVQDASGSGIGLAVVRDLVTGMGGTVTIGDAPGGRGARLQLELPAAG